LKRLHSSLYLLAFRVLPIIDILACFLVKNVPLFPLITVFPLSFFPHISGLGHEEQEHLDVFLANSCVIPEKILFTDSAPFETYTT
jgi:hypothetical protein